MQGIRICAVRFSWVDATAGPAIKGNSASAVVVHPSSLGVPWSGQCEIYLPRNSTFPTFQWREDGFFYESVLLLKLSRLFPGVQSFDGHSERDKQHPPKARETSLEVTDK